MKVAKSNQNEMGKSTLRSNTALRSDTETLQAQRKKSNAGTRKVLLSALYLPNYTPCLRANLEKGFQDKCRPSTDSLKEGKAMERP